MHPSALEQLGSLRLTLQKLAEAVEQAASARKHERSGDAFPAIASGGQSVWSLGVGGQAAKHIVQLDLVQPHIAALVGSGALAPWHATDHERVQHAVQLLLDRWSGLYTRSTRKSVSRSALSERRSGRDRRHASPLAGYLLSLIAGTPLERRIGSDRRLDAASTTAAAQSCGRLSAPTASAPPSRRVANVICFALAKAARLPVGKAQVAKASRSPRPSANVVAIGSARADQMLEVRLCASRL
jgi:hypothetical protein